MHLVNLSIFIYQVNFIKIERGNAVQTSLVGMKRRNPIRERLVYLSVCFLLIFVKERAEQT